MTSIIVTSFNNTIVSKHMTQACLANIAAYTDPKDYELILVDPVSDPHFAPNDYDPYNVLKIDKWLKPDPDPGYASCLNLGAKEAKGKYLVFVQNDAFVEKSWLDGLLKYLEKYDLVWPDQTPRSYEDIQRIDRLDWFDEEALHGWRDEGIFAITKEAWNKIGGYRDGFSLLAQKEFLNRVSQTDIKWVDICKVRFTHLMAGSNVQLQQHNPKEYNLRTKRDAEILNENN